ncbi:MAG: hypothetical protein QGG24_03730 [Vicinamibacterales bacterium]|nr:hypothetical protein [Acidobacteriota bacterium]MDP7294411.1 hypothetical protein [Vicinamibacterales bacterium]MDP7471725.1 hypothetical protein [Vicinamibacterales bacterium]MDP7672353.1 hypothetical protein [Vicinamibacterales bacterium]HJO37952.1 hypothetical protein [Vicinamibacterales bacterium]
MTFLALTATQVAWLCGLTLVAVIALFFLKLRYPRVAVASLLLWERVLVDNQHRSLLERLRRLLSLLLAITIALLIALALGRPEAGAITGEPREVVIVVDTSITMAAATADGQTRWDHAREAALRLIGDAGGADRFQVADTSGRVATAMTADRSQLDAALDRMTPTAARPTFPQLDLTDREVIVVSDGIARLALPRAARVLSVFEPADNVAIADLEVVAGGDGGGSEIRLVVANHSPDAKEVEIAIEMDAGGDPDARLAEVVTVAGRDVVARTIAIEGSPSGAILARVAADGDALAVDDEAVDYLPPPRGLSVALITSGNDFLETLLALDARVDLTVMTPDLYPGDEVVDLYVFDEFAPLVQPSQPVLLFRPPGRAWLAGSDATAPLRASETGVTDWDETHPILEFVSMLDVQIVGARHLEFATDAATRVVAAAGQTPLVVARSATPRWVSVNFALDDSDFAMRPSFPMFMQNVLTWFAGNARPLRRSVGTVEVALADATVATIDGADVPARSRLGATLFEAPTPGLYVASSGAARAYVAVNLPAGLSDVNGVTLTGRDRVELPPGRWLSSELWTYLLALALALAALEWWTYHRRITV